MAEVLGRLFALYALWRAWRRRGEKPALGLLELMQERNDRLTVWMRWQAANNPGQWAMVSSPLLEHPTVALAEQAEIAARYLQTRYGAATTCYSGTSWPKS